MKSPTFRKFSVLLISLSALVSGCTSTAEYKAFSKAGIDYSNALNELFECSGKVGLDSSSYRILETKEPGSINTDTYERIKKVDERRIELLNSTSEQVLLFRRYFVLLGDLASVGDTVPQAIGSEITSIANDLTAIKVKVTNNSEFPNQSFNTGIGNLGKWIISKKLKGAIRKELKNREQILKESFLIHDLLLNKLIDESNSDLNTIKNILENEKVLQPILENKPTDQLPNERQKIIGMQKLIWDLNSQRSLSKNFTKVFEEIITNRANLPRSTYLSMQASEGDKVFKALCKYTEYKQSKNINLIYAKSFFIQ